MKKHLQDVREEYFREKLRREREHFLQVFEEINEDNLYPDFDLHFREYLGIENKIISYNVDKCKLKYNFLYIYRVENFHLFCVPIEKIIYCFGMQNRKSVYRMVNNGILPFVLSENGEYYVEVLLYYYLFSFLHDIIARLKREKCDKTADELFDELELGLKNYKIFSEYPSISLVDKLYDEDVLIMRKYHNVLIEKFRNDSIFFDNHGLMPLSYFE